MLTYDILTVNSKKSNTDLNIACLNNLAIIMFLNSVINNQHGISLAACPQPPSVWIYTYWKGLWIHSFDDQFVIELI